MKTAEKKIRQSHGGIVTPQERAVILKRGYGAWKHRSLKADLRTLANLRKGWQRTID